MLIVATAGHDVIVLKKFQITQYSAFKLGGFFFNIYVAQRRHHDHHHWWRWGWAMLGLSWWWRTLCQTNESDSSKVDRQRLGGTSRVGYYTLFPHHAVIILQIFKLQMKLLWRLRPQGAAVQQIPWNLHSFSIWICMLPVVNECSSSDGTCTSGTAQ